MNRVALERYTVMLGLGLGRLAERAFRIGHLGFINEPVLIGTLGGAELALRAAGLPPDASGVAAALDELQ